jgi:xanthine dehydrogenase accessory factor
VSDRAAVWHAAARLARAEKLAALASVSRQRGSLPMASDAKMAVSATGERWGTIGGGCIEADVAAQALEASRSGIPTTVSHTLNADLAGDLGLSCGGTVDLFLEPVIRSAEGSRLYEVIAEGIEQRRQVTVYTASDWSEGPSKTVRVDEEEFSVGVSLAAVDPTEPGCRMTKDGVFVEPILRTPRVIVLGAGHVGAAISRIAAGAGFHVIVADDREEFANADRLPGANEVLVGHHADIIDRLVLDGDDYVLATTRGHSYDAEIVELVAASPARYVGMLGSRRKKEVIFHALAERGVPAEALARVRVPIGEAIGAETPEEIAVSVVAELIRVRRATP